jgi:NitT/TauT family transport system substrate-binding protein
VPAVALWVPFNIQVRARVPSAKMLVDASAYFPKSAIVGGWAVRADYYEKNRPILERVVRGWAASNDDLIRNSAEILPVIQSKNYAQVPLEELQEQFKASRYYPAAEWRKLYQDGTALGWLQQVTDFYARVGGIQNPVPAKTYFDTSLLVNNVTG